LIYKDLLQKRLQEGIPKGVSLEAFSIF